MKELFQSARYISLLVDENTDIKTEKKLLIYGGFVNTKTLDAQTHFISNMKVSDISVTADVVTTHLCKILEDFDIEIQKIYGFGSDGASLMTGCKNGVATHMKNKNPVLITIHCLANRLNLASSQAADKIPYLKDVFQKIMTDLYYYFSKSTARTSSLIVMQNILDEPQMKIKEIHAVRWFAFYDALQTIYKCWTSLVSFFVERKTESMCIGFSKKIAEFTFVSTLYFMMDVIPHLTELSLIFQKTDLDVSSVRPAIDHCKEMIRHAKDGNGYHMKLLNQIVVSSKGTELNGHLLANANSQGYEKAKKIREDFCDKLLENIDARFPESSLTVATAFDVLALKGIRLLSKDDQEEDGKAQIKVLVKNYNFF